MTKEEQIQKALGTLRTWVVSIKVSVTSYYNAPVELKDWQSKFGSETKVKLISIDTTGTIIAAWTNTTEVEALNEKYAEDECIRRLKVKYPNDVIKITFTSTHQILGD